jgi:radical SAM superfamily enzyme YgiQ (UPF0313 family)
MKKFLLINPWIYDFAAYDLWIKPLGLLYIASFLRKNGYEVRVIDCLATKGEELKSLAPLKKYSSGHGKFLKESIPKPEVLKNIPRRYHRYGITPDAFKASLQHYHPDIIFVTSMMTYWYPGVFETIGIVKTTYNDAPIILGGNYATLCPDHATTSQADFIITGEGEKKIPLLLKKLWGDTLSFMPDFNELDSYPYPAFDLLSSFNHVPILTSRGCPFRCTYCASHILNAKFRRRHPINVVNEINFWHKEFGIRHFSFYDDALLIYPDEMIVPILEEIIKRKLPCEFHCPNGLHLREVNSKISNLLFKANFRTIRFGFETSNSKKQSETGGKVNNEQLKQAIAYLREAGYQEKDMGIYILCGLPGQTAYEVQETIQYVKSCGARPIIAEYSPIPGTDLWKASVESSIYDISRDPLFHNNSILPCQSEELTINMYQHLKLLTKSNYRR